MDLNIALLPDRQTSTLLVNLNQNISRRLPTQLKLNEDNALPHLTLYLARFPLRNLLELGNRVKSVCSKFSPVEIRLLGARISATGSIMVECEGTHELRSLHQQIIRTASDLQEGIADVWAGGNEQLTPDEFRLLNEIGYPYGLELWQPHFTVAKINPLESFKIDDALKEFHAEFLGTRVGLCCSDQRGVVSGVLEAFNLQS